MPRSDSVVATMDSLGPKDILIDASMVFSLAIEVVMAAISVIKEVHIMWLSEKERAGSEQSHRAAQNLDPVVA